MKRKCGALRGAGLEIGHMPAYTEAMVRMSRNYRYFHRHFNELAKRHGGRMIVISGGRIFGVCRNERPRELSRLVEEARRASPQEVPFVSPVPTVKELASPLLL